jgi:hypothetical protein
MGSSFWFGDFQRLYHYSLSCSSLPSIYPECNYFWVSYYSIALALLAVICFYAVWYWYQQILLHNDFKRRMLAMSAMANNAARPLKWEPTIFLDTTTEAELSIRIQKLMANSF